MKKPILFFAMIFALICYPQGPDIGDPIPVTNGLDGNLFNFASLNSFTRVDYAEITIPKDKNSIEGNPYAFDKWKNKGYIFVDGKTYSLGNVNFNMYSNTIEAKVDDKSVYIFDLSNVNHAYINNRKFKNFFVNELQKNEILEVLFESDNLSLLKRYQVGIKKADIDPLMVKKAKTKYFTTESYYLDNKGVIESFTVNRKRLNNLFGDKATLIKKFAKKNKLSYKKINDVKKLLAHFVGL